MNLRDEIKAILDDGLASTDLGKFAEAVQGTAGKDDDVFVSDDEFRMFVLAQLAAHAQAILRVASHVENLERDETSNK